MTARGFPMEFPELALSVRQPWAWAIVEGHKDIENRSIPAIRNLCNQAFGAPLRGERAIHASQGMTRIEYLRAKTFMASIGVKCPAAADLKRGGIVGRVTVADVVGKSSSPWFFGPRGLVLEQAQRCAFIPAIGQLGYFRWAPADFGVVPLPARWMLEELRVDHTVGETIEPDLFGGGKA
jgi:hypothetical protein